jgi:hypothetical protein
MAYKQWVKFSISPKGFNLLVQNAQLKYGKFYKDGDNGNEISAVDIDKIEINDGSFDYVCACGRELSPSGTEGSFDLYDQGLDKNAKPIRIGTLNWNCSFDYVANPNALSWTIFSDNYNTQVPAPGNSGGALGLVPISCNKIK